MLDVLTYVLSALGIVGLFVHMLLLVKFWRDYRQAKIEARREPETHA